MKAASCAAEMMVMRENSCVPRGLWNPSLCERERTVMLGPVLQVAGFRLLKLFTC
jgi:hypothetical protein